MKETIEAIYENGIFRPLTRPLLPEGKRIKLTMESAVDENAEEILELAAKVYEAISTEEIEKIEKIAMDRSSFFDGKQE